MVLSRLRRWLGPNEYETCPRCRRVTLIVGNGSMWCSHPDCTYHNIADPL